MSFFGDASFQQMMDHGVDFGLTVRRATTIKIVVVQLLWEILKKNCNHRCDWVVMQENQARCCCWGKLVAGGEIMALTAEASCSFQ